jgi:hypothetical protein
VDSGTSQGGQGSSQGGQWGSRSSGGYAGRGPKGYRRSDERIREDISDQFMDNDELDASEIEVMVVEGRGDAHRARSQTGSPSALPRTSRRTAVASATS